MITTIQSLSNVILKWLKEIMNYQMKLIFKTKHLTNKENHAWYTLLSSWKVCTKHIGYHRVHFWVKDQNISQK